MFIVKYDETQENATYQYTDILTRTVELQVFDGQEYCPIIPPESQCKKKKESLRYRVIYFLKKFRKKGIFFLLCNIHELRLIAGTILVVPQKGLRENGCKFI